MTLIAIGGAEDKVGGMTILRRVLAEAKTEAPRVLVITTASMDPEAVSERYKNAFSALGVSCEAEYVATRAQANSSELAGRMAQADIVFFSGGDQLRLTTILGGTAMMDAVKERYESGSLVIAGTSAGAAAASSLMIYGGSPEQAMNKGSIPMMAGFGFVKGAVFDTHFGERNRLSRLFNAVSANPGLTGIGLDEDTGVVMTRDGLFNVIGSGHVTVVDGRAITSSTIAEVAIGGKFDVEGIQVTKLSAGKSFRLPGHKNPF